MVRCGLAEVPPRPHKGVENGRHISDKWVAIALSLEPYLHKGNNWKQGPGLKYELQGILLSQNLHIAHLL